MIELMHGRASERKIKNKYVKQESTEVSDYASNVGAQTPNLKSIASLTSQRMRTNLSSTTKSSFDFEGGCAKTKMMREKIKANNELFMLE